MVFKSDYQRADEVAGSSALASPKLKEHKAIAELVKVLDKRVRDMFVHGSLRGKLLILYFSHQIGVLEFNAKREHYLEAMRVVYKEKSLKEYLYFRTIEARLKPKPKERQETKESMPERAKGNFEINIKDPQIKGLFEKIRENIKNNQG